MYAFEFSTSYAKYMYGSTVIVLDHIAGCRRKLLSPEWISAARSLRARGNVALSTRGPMRFMARWWQFAKTRRTSRPVDGYRAEGRYERKIPVAKILPIGPGKMENAGTERKIKVSVLIDLFDLTIYLNLWILWKSNLRADR